MGLQPFAWSVVVRGSWNVAILTPGRIAERMFQLAPGTRVPVMVPMNAPIPCQVEHPDGKFSVAAFQDRLEIGLKEMDYNVLAEAMKAARNALAWLPETPVSAAGFNVYYKTDKPSTKMAEMCAKEDIDNALADLGYNITERSFIRTVQYKEGKLNVSVKGNDKYFELLCNFHRDSKSHQDLAAWLNVPVKDIEDNITKLLESFELNVQGDNL